MIITSCPQCREDVLALDGVRDDEEVRCPLCQAEFSFGEARRQLPPALIVVGSPVAAPADDGEEFRFAPDDQEERPSFDFSESPAPAGAATKTKATPRTRASRPSPKKQKSALWEIVKIVAGGVVGLAIALEIIWWVGETNWWKDSGRQEILPEFGHNVGRYAPYLVPPRFRPGAGDELPQGDAVDAEDDEFSFAKPQPKETASAPKKKKRRGVPLGTTPDFARQEEDDIAEDPGPPGKPAASPAAIEATASESPAREALAPEAPARDPNFLGVYDAPLFTAAEVEQALQKAETAVQSFVESGEPSPEEVYDALANLAYHATYVQESDKAAMDAIGKIEPLIRGEGRLSPLARLISDHGAQRLDNADRSQPGVVLIGTVRSITDQGPLFETVMDLAIRDGSKTTQMMSRKDPESLFDTGARLILFGTVIDDPQANLGGYTGDASQVVWGGYPVVISP